MDWATHAVIPLVVLAAAAAGTGRVIGILRRRAILDHPNGRSSHAVPTPRGGGLALVPAVAAGWAAAAMAAADAAPIWTVCALACGLALVSWLDDLRGLSPLARLAAHGAAVGIALWAGADGRTFFGGGLPPALDAVAAALLWVWFINLFNFMDGIDGISGVETMAVAGGSALVATVAGVAAPVAPLGLILAAGAIGFLWWNWHPARIFLGDVGSVPLGFLLGWLLLSLAAEGQIAAAAILPLYYLGDATLTLARRALRGEKVWRPHREHFYQRAVRRGMSHARVSTAVAAANLGLVALATLAARGEPAVAFVAAIAVVAVLLTWLACGRAP